MGSDLDLYSGFLRCIFSAPDFKYGGSDGDLVIKEVTDVWASDI